MRIFRIEDDHNHIIIIIITFETNSKCSNEVAIYNYSLINNLTFYQFIYYPFMRTIKMLKYRKIERKWLFFSCYAKIANRILWKVVFLFCWGCNELKYAMDMWHRNGILSKIYSCQLFMTIIKSNVKLVKWINSNH